MAKRRRIVRRRSPIEPQPLRVGGCFEGIGGFPLAAEALGLQHLWWCEWEPPEKEGKPVPRQRNQELLAKMFPHAKGFGDIAEVDPDDLPDIDVLTGGTPCQGFSVAGKRAGLGDHRSGLFAHFVRLIDALEKRGLKWVVWENVPGALTSSKGEDFANVIAALVGAEEPVRLPKHSNGRASRYSGVVDGPRGQLAWRVLDAQHFGVAQRRRRVIAVLHLGGRGAAEVLLEPQGRDGDPATCDPSEPFVARLVGQGPAGGGGADEEAPEGGPPEGLVALVPVASEDVAKTLDLGTGAKLNDSHTTFIPMVPPTTGTLTTAFGPKNYGNIQEVLEGSVVPVREAPAGTVTTHPQRNDLDCSTYVLMEEGAVKQAVAGVTPIELRNVVGALCGGGHPGGADSQQAHSFHLVPVVVAEANTGHQSAALLTKTHYDLDTETLLGVFQHAYRKVHRASSPEDAETWDEADTSNTLNLFDTGERDTHAVIYNVYPVSASKEPNTLVAHPVDIAAALAAGQVNRRSDRGDVIVNGYGVRRLTPTECERLQGFPSGTSLDDATGWTGGQPDSTRYRQLGNAVAVPVAGWTLARIAAHEAGVGWQDLPGVRDVLLRMPWILQHLAPPMIADPEARVELGGALAFDWQASGANDKSWDGKARSWLVKMGDYAGALSTTKVQAVMTNKVAEHGEEESRPTPERPAKRRRVVRRRVRSRD